MYLSPDDARSDVILAGATVLFGGVARAIAAQLPFYPRSGMVAATLDLAWILVLTGLVPLLLARHRGDGAAAFGLDGPRAALRAGLLVAAPVAVTEGVLSLLRGAPSVLGRLTVVAVGRSTTTLVIVAAQIVLLTLGATLLVAFLGHRGRDAFPRSPEMPLTALLRTFGMSAAAGALVLGLARSVGRSTAPLVLVTVVGLVAVLLLADRLIPHGTRVPRAAVLAPALVVLATHVFATGGLLRGNLVDGLYLGSLAVGTTVAAAALTQVRRLGWAIVPLLAATHWWSSCLSPLTFGLGGC